MDCQVSNYPLKERSKEELETLKKALQLKRAETANVKVQIMIFSAGIISLLYLVMFLFSCCRSWPKNVKT